MQKKEKVLVTGANGLLGANITFHLAEKGYEVIALMRKNSNRRALDGINCKIIEGNITSVQNIETALKNCHYVIHCAAKTEQSPSRLENYKEINIEFTRKLIQLCKQNGIKRFVHVSTVNCFTNGTRKNPGTENGGFMSWLKKSGYAYSKYLAQQMVLEETRKNQFPAIVIVPTFIIGHRDAKPSSGKLLLHGLKNKIVFYPPGGKSFVDVDHVAEAAVNALTMGRLGECYFLAGENLSYKEFFKRLANVSGKSKVLVPIPKILLVAVAYIFSLLEKIFNASLTLNRTNQRLLCLNNYFSNKKAKDELELKETSVNDSIIKAYKWFKINKYI